MSNSASATASSVPKAGGLCGFQHGNTPCLPEDGQTCCSINGFCGSTEAYCFKTNGCQYGCIEPDVFYSLRAPTLSTSVIVISSTASSSPTTSSIPTTLATSPTASSATHSPTPTRTPSPVVAQHGLQGKAKIGVAVGVSVGGTLVLFLLGFLLWHWVQWKKDAADEAERKRIAEQRERRRQVEVPQQNGSEAPPRTKTPLNVIFGSSNGVVENE